MFKYIEDDVAQSLEGLKHRESLDAWNVLRRAWRRTVVGDETSDGRLLLPFVGSGMNRLSQGGVDSWADLVNQIRAVVLAEWTTHDLSSARLSFPEELELLLAKASEFQHSIDKVCEIFWKMFGESGRPSDVHERLVRLFPRLVTTNYNRLLGLAAEAAGTGHKEFDLTMPETQPGRPYLVSRSILHLHGIWHGLVGKDHIFWGVGKHPAADQGGVLVLTEHQYHRLYLRRVQFQRTVNRLFSDENLLLFIGAGLSRDELGVHSYLRELQMAGGQELVGIHIGTNTNAAMRQLLLARGIATIQIPNRYGFSRSIQRAVWHAFLNVCEREFGSPSPSTIIGFDVPEPEIICVGLSSRQTVIALTAPPQEEGSCWVPRGSRVEESAGQHLVPSIAMARRGHRVALVTRFGTDDDGDRILQDLPRLVGDGDIDIQLASVFQGQPRHTRHTYVVTYRNQGGRGVRTCYDWEDAPVASTGTWHDTLDGISVVTIEKLLRRFRHVRALYLGAPSVQINASLLRLFPDVRYRFLETATSGCDDGQWSELIGQARACTHVIASAKFIARLLEPTHLLSAVPLSGIEYQERLASSLVSLRAAHVSLFEGAPNRHLIATLGSAGAAYISSGDLEARHVPVSNTPATQVAWIGCGDVFRGVFISALLQGNDIRTSIVMANQAAADRTAHVPTFVGAQEASR